MFVNPRPSRISAAAFACFVFLVSCADLKRFAGDRIHWYAFGVLLVLILPMISRARWRIHTPMAIAASMVVCAVLVSGWDEAVYSALLAGKLTLILVLLAHILLNHPELARGGFLALEVAVYVNILLLATLAVQPGPLASLMAPGRWGTALNAPGSLWRVGIAPFLYGGYLIAAAPRLPLRAVALCLASITLIYADGSRTAMLLLMASGPFLLVLVFWELRRRSEAVRGIAVVAALALCAFCVFDLRRVALGSDAGVRDAMLRVQPVWDSLTDPSQEELSLLDPGRYEMLGTVIEKVKANPVFGDGMGRTRVESRTGSMVIHMTYLQVWGDLGLLGFAGYVWFTCGWIPRARLARNRIRCLGTVRDRALYANALFLLFVFCASAFLHPMSTELSEWMPFLLAFALFHQLVGDRRRALPAQ